MAESLGTTTVDLHRHWPLWVYGLVSSISVWSIVVSVGNLCIIDGPSVLEVGDGRCGADWVPWWLLVAGVPLALLVHPLSCAMGAFASGFSWRTTPDAAPAIGHASGVLLGLIAIGVLGELVLSRTVIICVLIGLLATLLHPFTLVLWGHQPTGTWYRRLWAMGAGPSASRASEVAATAPPSDLEEV